ncbi:cytochrome P450 89A9 [Lolium perenne]|uniref:cytochrome P450 89A9 n=1 Tax=Lolium perenne TaxID=4522 RepID=UPI0021EA309C|nr:cytochrome P450 89A2-like [Lolium perenne]
MELLVFLALVLVGFSFLLQRRRSCSSAKRACAPAPVVIQKIGDPAVAHRALVENADDFSNRPLAPFLRYLAEKNGGRRGESLASVSHSPLWRAFRCNLTAETLHPSRLGHLAPLQREGIEALVARLSSSAAAAGEGAIPVREHLCNAVFPVIARLCFGDGVDGCHVRAMGSVIQSFQQIAVGEARASPGTLRARFAEWRRLRRLLALHGRLGELFLPLVAARRKSRGPCNGLRPYVDSLIDLRVPVDGDDGGGRRGVRDDEMVNLFSEFLGAGAGTIGACLEWTLAHLVNRQDVQQKLREEVDGGDVFRRSLIRGMPYLNAVVLESLRLHPLVPFMQRHVQADVAERVVGVGGTATVPAAAAAAGDVLVQFTLGDIGRDKHTWKDPDEFRPERFLPGGEAEDVGPLPGPREIRMMPFGAGHRFCPGSGVAMVNIKCFLAALVLEFQWAPPTEDCAAVDLTELDTFIKTMKKPLSARLTPRVLL